MPTETMRSNFPLAGDNPQLKLAVSAGPSAAPILGHGDLLGGQCEPGDLGPLLGEIHGQPAPAAADIENLQTGPVEISLAAI